MDVQEAIIQQASQAISDGEVILYPTDTIWGLGCSAMNEDAVDRIFELKNREKEKSVIILVKDIDQLKGIVGDIHPKVENILHFHDRPLTLIFRGPLKKKLAPGCIANDGSIAARIPKDEFCSALLQTLNVPIVSTSANLSGSDYPKNFSDIKEKIVKGVDMVIPSAFEPDDENQVPSVIAYCNPKSGELDFIRM